MARLLFALALTCAATAGAQAPADADARARAHFETGQGLHHLGDYSGAIREFAAGYVLRPRPEFLLNIGQAYRRLGALPEARSMYQRFLVEADPAHASRKEVERLIAEVDAELARARTPGTLAKPIALAELAAPSPAPAPTPAPPPLTPPPPPPSNRRTVIAVVVVAAVLVVAAAVGLAVGLAYQRDPTPTEGVAVFGH
jgi:tetratricopeptide (TPR) repeat protein